MHEALLIFYQRPARARARQTAVAEALSLLRDLGGSALPGGPLAEERGVFWVSLPGEALDRARPRLPYLGYSHAVDLAAPAAEREARSARDRVVRWRRGFYRLVRLYEDDPEALRESAPDRRAFALETRGGVREVRGYRGDSRELGRRGLPVPDARMLVNLVSTREGATFLDPFAGAGGIVIEALARGWRVLSADRDPALRYGLSGIGARHAVADARRLPFGDATIDAVATEPPYEREAEGVVVETLAEMCRVLRSGGRLAMLCASWQADGLRRKAASLGFSLFHNEAIDRKGTECAVLGWERT